MFRRTLLVAAATVGLSLVATATGTQPASAGGCGPWNNWCEPACGPWNGWCSFWFNPGAFGHHRHHHNNHWNRSYGNNWGGGWNGGWNNKWARKGGGGHWNRHGDWD
jgi:hypothetical protein